MLPNCQSALPFIAESAPLAEASVCFELVGLRAGLLGFEFISLHVSRPRACRLGDTVSVGPAKSLA